MLPAYARIMPICELDVREGVKHTSAPTEAPVTRDREQGATISYGFQLDILHYAASINNISQIRRCKPTCYFVVTAFVIKCLLNIVTSRSRVSRQCSQHQPSHHKNKLPPLQS